MILDGTWRDEGYRERARRLAAETSATMVELACVAALDASITRIRSRTESSSQVTPEIATALADHPDRRLARRASDRHHPRTGQSPSPKPLKSA